jgi:hypothetical protein
MNTKRNYMLRLKVIMDRCFTHLIKTVNIINFERMNSKKP